MKKYFVFYLLLISSIVSAQTPVKDTVSKMINDSIKTNGSKTITAAMLNKVLHAITDVNIDSVKAVSIVQASAENNFTSSVSFATGSGILTLQRAGLSALNVSIDGRFVKYTDTAAMLTLFRSTLPTQFSADSINDGTNKKAYTATEKAKLATIANNATANSSDATLLARANHTGVQPATSITEDATHRFLTDAERTKITATTGTNTGDETGATIRSKLGVTTLSGSNTGDQDLSGYATTSTINTALALKANLADPTFSGTPKIGSDTVATKAYARSVGGTGGAATTSAADLTSGTLADARLSTNVTQNTATQTLTNKTLTSPVIGTILNTGTLTLPTTTGTLALTSQITGTNSGTNTGDETGATIRTKLGVTTLSGSNTGDQDLSGYSTTSTINTALALKMNAADTSTMLTNYRNTLATNTAAIALKANSASPTLTGTVVLPSTTSIGSITNTELSYVDGVTSAIQGQIDAKASAATVGAKADTSRTTQLADYNIYYLSPTYYAIPRYNSNLGLISSSDAKTVIQTAINNITPSGSVGTTGGTIVIQQGSYSLSDEVTIVGWEGGVAPYSQIVISGMGFGTNIIQNTSGKNAFVVKNRASVVLKDMRISNGSAARSCILGDDNGTNEGSMSRSVLENLMLTSNSTGYAPLYLKNPFDVTVNNLFAQTDNNHAIILENTSTTTNYGNSQFNFVRTIAGNAFPFAGLVSRSINSGGAHFINECTFSKYQQDGGGYYGIWADYARNFTFNDVDIENVKKPIYLGSTTGNAWAFTFNGGYLLPLTSTDTSIHCTVKSGANKFHLWIDGDATSKPIVDQSEFLSPNSYDVDLGYSVSPANISITNTQTAITYRSQFDYTSKTTIPSLRITGGSPGLNKVLTSDATGNASWTTPSSSTPADGTITNAKLSNVATATLKGRTTAGTGVPEDLTTTQARTMLSVNNVDNTSDASKPVSTAQQTALDAKLSDELFIAGAQAAGSTLKALPLIDVMSLTEQVTMSSGDATLVAVYLPKPTTITGVKFLQGVAGVYTASAFNGVGLYSVSGGTATLVATSANNGTAWKATANSMASLAFTGTYAAAKGWYYIALNYNQSAQTTAPSLYGKYLTNAVFSTLDFTNGNVLSGAAFNNGGTLPGTIALSGLYNKGQIVAAMLY